jgi:hypothetical protein
MSVSDAAQRCPGAIGDSWPAVVCSHGRPYRWELGLIRDHPLRYTLSFLQMVIGLIGVTLGVKQMKRFQ